MLNTVVKPEDKVAQFWPKCIPWQRSNTMCMRKFLAHC